MMHIRSAATTMTSLALLARHVAGFHVSSRVRVRVMSSARPPSSSCSCMTSMMQRHMSTSSSTGASSGTAAAAATRGQQPTDHAFDFETPIDRSNTGEAGAGASLCVAGGRVATCLCLPLVLHGSSIPRPVHAGGKLLRSRRIDAGAALKSRLLIALNMFPCHRCRLSEVGYVRRQGCNSTLGRRHGPQDFARHYRRRQGSRRPRHLRILLPHGRGQDGCHGLLQGTSAELLSPKFARAIPITSPSLFSARGRECCGGGCLSSSHEVLL